MHCVKITPWLHCARGMSWSWQIRTLGYFSLMWTHYFIELRSKKDPLDHPAHLPTQAILFPAVNLSHASSIWLSRNINSNNSLKNRVKNSLSAALVLEFLCKSGLFLLSHFQKSFRQPWGQDPFKQGNLTVQGKLCKWIYALEQSLAASRYLYSHLQFYW